jgi:hypothetical protein
VRQRPAPGILAAAVVELPELDGARIAILGLHTASAAPSCICVTWVKLPGALAMLDARLSISRARAQELSGAEAVSSW